MLCRFELLSWPNGCAIFLGRIDMVDLFRLGERMDKFVGENVEYWLQKENGQTCPYCGMPKKAKEHHSWCIMEELCELTVEQWRDIN